MRHYEPFKSEAQRLTSITCDRCGQELYRAAHQPYGCVGYGRHYPSQKYDLCPEHLAEVGALIEQFVAKEEPAEKALGGDSVASPVAEEGRT